jgi:hypothetical protein
MQIKSDLNIYNRAIGSQSKISGLIKAEIDSDSGEIVFRSLFDGFFSTEIEKTSAHVEALGINDLRVFDSSGQATLGTRQGLTQVADEARVINERLRNASPETQDLLNRLNLGHLLNPGSDVSLTYAHFKHSGKVQNLKNLLDNGNVALESALKVATESDSPRAFEVVAILLKTIADLNNNVLDVHKKAKDTTQQKIELKQTNNSVFVGSTKELQNLKSKFAQVLQRCDNKQESESSWVKNIKFIF